MADDEQENIIMADDEQEKNKTPFWVHVLTIGGCLLVFIFVAFVFMDKRTSNIAKHARRIFNDRLSKKDIDDPRIEEASAPYNVNYGPTYYDKTKKEYWKFAQEEHGGQMQSLVPCYKVLKDGDHLKASQLKALEMKYLNNDKVRRACGSGCTFVKSPDIAALTTLPAGSHIRDLTDSRT